MGVSSVGGEGEGAGRLNWALVLVLIVLSTAVVVFLALPQSPGVALEWGGKRWKLVPG